MTLLRSFIGPTNSPESVEKDPSGPPSPDVQRRASKPSRERCSADFTFGTTSGARQRASVGLDEKQCDTLAWATGTHVGAGDHAIALFSIGCGRVLGFLYSDTFTLHFKV